MIRLRLERLSHKIDDDPRGWETVAPLHAAGVTKEDVAEFWASQPPLLTDRTR